MTVQRLPKFVDPLRFADLRREVAGEIAVADLPRLCQLLEDTRGMFRVVIRFARDEKGIITIHGNFSGTISMVCQRCLEAMPVHLDENFVLSPVESDFHAQQLPASYEPLLTTEDTIVLNAMVEDEILLRLPCQAKHESCKSLIDFSIDERFTEVAVENPFAVLRQ